MTVLTESKSLPHSEESERAVLAAVMLDAGRHLPTTASRLTVDDFYLERHRKLYQGMLDLQAEGVEIDLRTVQARLEQREELDSVGGLAYLASLDVDLPDLSRVATYVEIIKERALRRQLIHTCSEIYNNSFDGGLEAREALDRAETAILRLGEAAISRGFVPLHAVFRDTLAELEAREEGALPGVRTGFLDLDPMIHGLNPGNLLVIAGRPGMGKTSFAVNVAQHVAIQEGLGVGVFSLEMNEQELALRVLSAEAEIEFTRLRQARLVERDWTRIYETVRRIGSAPLFVDDSANPSLLEVASKARRLKADGKLHLLIIDYLQLMQSGMRFENRNLEIGAITRGLKQLAKELEIPVMALSQLSRQPERRGSDRRPQLADLRESGSIEQDADAVLFIYRDEVYHPDDPENHGLAELIVSKNRHGATGTVELAFIGAEFRFRNLEKYAVAPREEDLEPQGRATDPPF